MQLLLFVLFLLLALLVLLQELAVRIDFNAPLCAFFVHDGFVNGFALFRLLLDLDDLAGASFVFNCRLHRSGQIGHLNGLLIFFLCISRRPGAKRQDRGYCDYWNDVFHVFLYFLVLIERRINASGSCFSREEPHSLEGGFGIRFTLPIDKRSRRGGTKEILKFSSGFKVNPKNAAAIRIVLEHDSPAIALDCLFGDGEAEANAALWARSRFIDTKKSLENFLMIFARYSRTVVLHRDVDLACRPRRRD